MPHVDFAEYTGQVNSWRQFLYEFTDRGNRAVFTCRTLDYSVPLGSQENGVALERAYVRPMSDSLMLDYLRKYFQSDARGEWVFRQLTASPNQAMDMYRNPYMLRVLVDAIGDGDIPKGRADLFTRLTQETLYREVVDRHTPALLETVLLDPHDQAQISNRLWHGHRLPERGVLVAGLALLAYQMQSQKTSIDGAQVSVPRQTALALVGRPEADLILRAGAALGTLDEDLGQDEVFFAHQLLQEYFAARHFASNPAFDLVCQPWRVGEATPTLEDVLRDLGPRDPLPPLPTSGWEETVRIAAAIARDHEVGDSFLSELSTVNLPLAGLAASSADVAAHDEVVSAIRGSLVERTRDPEADLRARLAAGFALGELGDPRFLLADTTYFPPVLVGIRAGRYVMGDDSSINERERPAGAVHLNAYSIGAFPVTVREYARFLEANGYDEPRWWDTPGSEAWRNGSTATEAEKEAWRVRAAELRDLDDAEFATLIETRAWSATLAEDYALKRSMTAGEFDEWLEDQYPLGTRYREPRFWRQDDFRNPAQPVVGVSWFEARAYCAWLGAQMARPVRLATEAEWETAGKLAGGYTWTPIDKCIANTVEARIGKPSPVGIFPPLSISGDGELFDMRGNVSEWTSTVFAPYPYAASDDLVDSHSYRVLRGMSWSARLSDTRITSRRMFPPAARANTVGFRVAVS